MRSGLISVVAVGAFLVGCGDDGGAQFNNGDGSNNNNGDGDCQFTGCQLGDGGGSEATPPCVGLQCQQVDCQGKGQPPTTLSGTVFAPNGTLPIYNVIVYVPNAPLAPIANGATCDKCGSTISGNPVVTALTDATGKFTLKNVPVGKDIPLVFQIGKWRRKVVIPEVKQCVDTPLPDANVTRLPKNQSEGDIPRIALTTGAADPLGCILPKLGLDAVEFTASAGVGKVNTYNGNSAGPAYATSAQNTFWNDSNTMKKYDIVVLSCEGGEYLNTKPVAARAEMQKYLDMGGRVFGSHYHYVWFQYGPAPFPTTATWQGDGMGPGVTAPFKIDTSFPKGKALADWLKFVEPTLTYGEMPINQIKNDVGVVNNATSTRWVYASTNPESTKYLSFNTPVGVMPDQQCGKAVFGDLHIGAGSVVNGQYPASCPTTLTPQEKALIFLFFDLSSCVQTKDSDPLPPPPPPK
jgi:hypothetical protein